MQMVRTRSIRFRLTIWYAVVLTAGLSLFGGLMWLSMRQRLMGEIDRDLQGRASRFEQYFRTESADASGTQLRDELDEFCQALPASSYLTVGGRGFEFRYPSVTPEPASEFRVLRRQFNVNGETFELEIGAPVAEARHTLDLLRLLLWSLIPVVIAIASIGGAWLARRALSPVQDITAAALTISIENLSERLPVPPTGDEFARLSEVLNTMLARLESAVKTLSQFVADASHELRTPLAVIRTTADLALRRARTPESYRESLQDVAVETERMTHLLEDLLLLARSDTGTAEMPLDPIDVREVLQSVCAEMRTLAGLRGIQVNLSLGNDAAMVAGNRPALHRLFLVLLDNAVKYSRGGGEVAVNVHAADSRVYVTIADSGPGISESDLPHIFKRFYRADRARTKGGYGLGLALAESIVRAHGASIEVETSESGSVFRVRFALRDAKPKMTGETASFFRESSV